MANKQQRRKCRIPIIAFSSAINTLWEGHTRTIGHDGVYISRSYSFPINSELTLLIRDGNTEITLLGTVSRIGLRGSDIHFDALTPQQKRALDQIMHPEWQSGTLLDCLLVVARHNSMRTLSDCFKLTSLLEKHRKHTPN